MLRRHCSTFESNFETYKFSTSNRTDNFRFYQQQRRHSLILNLFSLLELFPIECHQPTEQYIVSFYKLHGHKSDRLLPNNHPLTCRFHRNCIELRPYQLRSTYHRISLRKVIRIKKLRKERTLTQDQLNIVNQNKTV